MDTKRDIIKTKRRNKEVLIMSERSYWRRRPAAREIYERRVATENASNFRFLAQGIGFAALLLAVFGVCMGNIELVATAAVIEIVAKIID